MGKLAVFDATMARRIALHADKWFKGEHQAILDRSTFESAQELLKSNVVKRKVKFSQSGALLQGKIFDDKGNRMGPSFSTKNGVRYRFYVSTALRGRKHNAGTVTRIPAPEVEGLVTTALNKQLGSSDANGLELVERITVSTGWIKIALKSGKGKKKSIDIPWLPKPKDTTEVKMASSAENIDQKLLKSIVRAHAWHVDLLNGRYPSIEDLAVAANLNPKVIRQGLRLAFLPPELTTAAVGGEATCALKQIPKFLPLSWREQRSLLG